MAARKKKTARKKPARADLHAQLLKPVLLSGEKGRAWKWFRATPAARELLEKWVEMKRADEAVISKAALHRMLAGFSGYPFTAATSFSNWLRDRYSV